MNDIQSAAVANLARVYTRYCVEDFRDGVLNHLSGSMTVSPELIASQTHIPETIDVSAANPITRFVHENAVFALEKNFRNPESREVWDRIKVLPSAHHEDVNAAIFHSAALFQKTVDEIIINTIGADTVTALETITENAKSRESKTSTGGAVHRFTWGMLSDGLWLNNALNMAFEKYHIFRPGDKPTAYWCNVAFNFARQFAEVGVVDHNTEGDYGVLMSHATESLSVPEDAKSTDLDLRMAIYRLGSLRDKVESWSRGITKPKIMMDAVRELSQLAVTVPTLIETAASLDDSVMSQKTKERLDTINHVVTMCLVGFNALRESRYSDTLILAADKPTEDPIVDLYTNGDLMNSFLACGAMESDLSYIGLHLLDTNVVQSDAGWNMEWVVNRKDDIIAQVKSKDQERQRIMRDNDANFLRNDIRATLGELAQSYADANGRKDLLDMANAKINDITRQMISPDKPASVDREVATMLASLLGDDTTERMTKTLMEFSSSQDVQVRKAARALTVAQGAIDEVIGLMV